MAREVPGFLDLVTFKALFCDWCIRVWPCPFHLEHQTLESTLNYIHRGFVLITIIIMSWGVVAQW